MKVLFSHQDNSGDTVEINEGPRAGELSVDWVTDGSSYVNLPREAVKALWTALGEWLHPDAGAAPLPYANQSLIEQMIQRAVKDQVAAVLPLHLSPVAAVCGTTGCQMTSQPDPEPHDVGHVDEPACARSSCTHPRSDHGRGFSTACDCGDCFEYTTVAPQIVAYVPERPAGHPTEDEWAQAPGRRVGNDGVPLPYCKESSGGCGHSWGQHTGGTCKARNFDLSNRAHNPCGCPARPQAECTCEHLPGSHSFTSGGCDHLGCECTWAVAP